MDPSGFFLCGEKSLRFNLILGRVVLGEVCVPEKPSARHPCMQGIHVYAHRLAFFVFRQLDPSRLTRDRFLMIPSLVLDEVTMVLRRVVVCVGFLAIHKCLNRETASC